MPRESGFKPFPFLFISKGLHAREAVDRLPDGAYLNMEGILEREENALSSRFGSIIVNREPDTPPYGHSPANYLFPSAPVVLSRLRSLNGSTYRYAALADGSLWRRATDTQGEFEEILPAAGSPPIGGLSGQPFTTQVLTCFNSSIPYLFLCDSQFPVKDNGTGTPTRIGIWPPSMPAITRPYAPRFLLLDAFTDPSSGYSTSGVSLGTATVFASIPGTSGIPLLDGDYWQFNDDTDSYGAIPDGMLVTSQALAPSTPNSGTATATASIMTPLSPNDIGWEFVSVWRTHPSGSPAYTSPIVGSAYNFSIPSSAVVTGIEVTYAMWAQSATFDTCDTVQLYLGNVPIGDPKSPGTPIPSGNWSQSFFVTVGSSIDDWGLGGALIPELINSNSLGVNVQATFSGVREFISPPVITVYYTYSSSGLGTLRLKFNTQIVDNSYDIVSPDGVYTDTDTFEANGFDMTIPASATGYIGKGMTASSPPGPVDLSNYNPADLIVLVLAVDSPSNVQEIRVMFDVANSDYGASYYAKSAIPVSYQGYLDGATVSPTAAVNTEYYNLITGAINTRQQGQPTTLPSSDPALHGLQPLQLTSGLGSWSVVYLQKGDFLPVGNAGAPGADWTNITGWRIQVTTNSGGSSLIKLNGLYIQGDPQPIGSPPVPMTGAGTNAGPSSYAGVGYDLRYIYWNANTGTPSNPSPRQFFPVTKSNPGGVSTLVVLRQAIDVIGQYSDDPQTTHIRIFVRGGLYGDYWRYADQIPNVTGTAHFRYKYIMPDTVLSQGDLLGLANDVPVTSTLQNPISTTLSAALSPGIPATATGSLLTVTVTDPNVVFVGHQIVNIGTPSNLEQTTVVTGGTGAFTAWVQLTHAWGEPVEAYSIPGQPCTLSAWAYDTRWLAGDPNNPHYLYYCPKGYPENCPPQNYIPVGSPSSPIVAIVNQRGTLFVGTLGDTWYQVFPGTPPYAQTTASKHGPVASLGWCLDENQILYEAQDGIRTFRGVDGPYLSLPIEWLWRNNSMTPVPLIDTTQLSSVLAALWNTDVWFSYLGQDGLRHRLIWSNVYKRWRCDNVQVCAMNLEADTNLLTYAKPMTIDGVSGWAVCYDTFDRDYDDGGWVGGELVQLPVPVSAQTPYLDQGAPNNPKQYSVLTIDANPNGQTLTPFLLFDDNNGTVLPAALDPASFTGAVRAKFQFKINADLGQQAYRCSLGVSGSVLAAPVLYQANVYADVLADLRAGFDSYWQRFGTDGSKFAKQVFADYTSLAGLTLSLYADGSDTAYYSVTLPANPNRTQVPMRVRLPAQLFRLLRVTVAGASGSQFQIWSLRVEWKPAIGAGAKGYAEAEMVVV